MSDLTTAVLLSAALCMAPAPKNNEAFNKYLEATYATTGWDQYRRNLEKRYIPDKVTRYGGYMAIMYRVYKDQTIKVAWTF